MYKVYSSEGELRLTAHEGLTDEEIRQFETIFVRAFKEITGVTPTEELGWVSIDTFVSKQKVDSSLDRFRWGLLWVVSTHTALDYLAGYELSRKEMRAAQVPSPSPPEGHGKGFTETSMEGLQVKAAVQIFLSYAREDEDDVEKLYQELSEAGFKPWMDKKDILPGEQWKSSIQQAIRRSDFFLACLSANSVNKRGFLQKEIKDALDIWQEMLVGDIYLIPVRLEDCEVPESLRDFQWVNLFEESGWTRLVEAIREGMKRRAQVSADEVPSPDMEMTIPEEGPEQVRSKPMPIRSRGDLIQKIGFDYFPEESPIRSGWAVEGTLPEFTLTGCFGEKALAVQQVDWYALDCDVEPGTRLGEFVEFVAKFKSGAAVYAHIDVQSKDHSESERGWIKLQIGTSQPQRVSHNEWVLYVMPTELEGNWQVFHIDLIDAVNRTFGNEGKSFEQLIGFRLRGNLELAYISVFESHEKPSLDMEMATPGEGPDQVQKLSVNKSSSAQTPIIRSVLLSTDAIRDGGSITVTVSVQSNAPVNWLNRSLDGPGGNIYGGGSERPFTEVSPGIWETQWTDKISRWYPSGIYTYSNISIRNEGLLTSATWPPLTFTVNNPD